MRERAMYIYGIVVCSQTSRATLFTYVRLARVSHSLSLSISLCVCQFQVKLFAVHTSLLLMFDKVDPYLARLPSGPIDNKYFIVVLILLSIGKHLIAHLIV